MKLIKLFTLLSATLIAWQLNAQIFGNDPAIEVDGLESQSVWQIAEMAMNDNEIPVGQLNMAEEVLLSDWIEWKTITIQNHARLYFKFEAPVLTVKIADRQYKSEEGWSEAVGNLSKKNYKKYVQSVADRIEQINQDEALTRQAVKTSKLIPAFNAINKVGDAEIKVLSSEQTENNRPKFHLLVTNTGKKALKLTMFDGDFHSMDGKSTARSRIHWETPDASDQRSTVIMPGKTTNLDVEIGAGYHLETAQGFAMTTKWKLNDADDYSHMKIYNIPIPYKYKDGD